MPKAPKVVPPPNTPTVANYMSRSQSRAGMGQRPNKLLRPVTGASASISQRTSLLGGV